MISTRFLTGSLAGLAVASAFTLATPAANADVLQDRPCGAPAVEAVYETIVHPPVFRTIPAVTHLEWRWERDVTAYEFQFSKEISPAGVETDWTRSVPGPTEYLFSHKVITQAAVPATPETPATGHFDTVVITPAVTVFEVEYRQQSNGKLRWESPDFGGQNGGWEKTGNTRDRVLVRAVTAPAWVIDTPLIPGTPAIPEVSHTDTTWATTSPGADWVGPLQERPGTPTTENATTDGSAPAGAGWKLVDTRVIDAVIDTLWATTAPDGYTPTGASRIAGTDHEETAAPSAVAPEGEGWTKVAGSESLVTDTPETTELVTPGSTEQVLLSPALPATDACVAGPTDGGGGADGPEVATESGNSTDDGVLAPVADQAAAAPSTVDTVLPNTGNGVPPWMAPTGIAAMLAGAVLIRKARSNEA